MLLLFVGYTYLYVMHKSIWTGWRIHYQGPLPLQSSFPNLRHADPRQVLHRNRGGTVVAIPYLLSEVTFFFLLELPVVALIMGKPPFSPASSRHGDRSIPLIPTDNWLEMPMTVTITRPTKD